MHDLTERSKAEMNDKGISEEFVHLPDFLEWGLAIMVFIIGATSAPIALTIVGVG